MTKLQKNAINEIIALVDKSRSGILEMEKKIRELDRKIGVIRSENDSQSLQELHLEVGRIINFNNEDALRNALEWLDSLNE